MGTIQDVYTYQKSIWKNIESHWNYIQIQISLASAHSPNNLHKSHCSTFQLLSTYMGLQYGKDCQASKKVYQDNLPKSLHGTHRAYLVESDFLERRNVLYYELLLLIHHPMASENKFDLVAQSCPLGNLSYSHIYKMAANFDCEILVQYPLSQNNV